MKKKQDKRNSKKEFFKFPLVTIQLPIYNEKYVVERLIDGILKLEYPKDRLEIQILDDSTDETSAIIKKIIKEKKNTGFTIHYIHRADRSGYKAGALQNGLKKTNGEFLAIFDADFIPDPAFLKKTLPYFQPNTGLVQTRWVYLNESFGMLTKLQAFGLDAHFTVEQSGRSQAKSFINFNGTAGIWRKKCVVDAGGWSSDTLTEDLDLSYRAQLKNWKFIYLHDVSSPCELPTVMSSIKTQQHRWNKGGAETAKKHLMNVIKSKMPFRNKLHAIFHLLNSSIYFFVLLYSILSVPILYFTNQSNYQWIVDISGFLLISFFSIVIFYWVATKEKKVKNHTLYFLKHYLLFIIILLGLTFHNGLAVIQGWIGKKSAFVRTPKFNIKSRVDTIHTKYLNPRFNFYNVIEFCFFIYYAGAIWLAFEFNNFGVFIFHLMLFLGYGIVNVLSFEGLFYEKK